MNVGESVRRALGVWPGDSKGRVHEEPPDGLRDAFEVDRQRVLGSAAFRRLQYKTQVFVNVEHDHFRTRLTHTLEVAEMSRRLAVGLGVNERLAEVIALAHDLGHPPFGHAGEAELEVLMAEHGGFEHNLQSLRVVDYLEHPYPPFRGLNLTFETREGLVKHSSLFDHPDGAATGHVQVGDLLESGPSPSLEGQIASVADRIAYDCHDLEDAIGAGMVGEDDLKRVELWRVSADPVRGAYPGASLAAIRRPILVNMVDRVLRDVVAETADRIRRSGATEVGQVRRRREPMVCVSASIEGMLSELERLLAERVYRDPRVTSADAEAKTLVRRLFERLQSDPSLLPGRFYDRISEQGAHRVICDYVAGMTDRYCRSELKRVCG